jgi:NAD(P)-dependent dehydrogenase (short-subunit alcohol dehydrogenase family)
MNGAILVTGGASGIGRATVAAVLAEGWRAVVLDLPGAALDRTRADLDPARVRCTALDVSDEAAVAEETAAIERDFGPLAGVVNSAGLGRDEAMLATSAETFRRILEVNVIGSFVVAREAARAMRGRGGAIVNIASVSGIRGSEGRVAYGASKGAVITMSRVMAVELAPLGIRVNVVAPGPVETPMVAAVHTPEVRELDGERSDAALRHAGGDRGGRRLPARRPQVRLRHRANALRRRRLRHRRHHVRDGGRGERRDRPDLRSYLVPNIRSPASPRPGTM